jgi:hypothetical protein
LKGRSAAFQLALSHWVADDADGDEDVSAFRKRHLPDGDVMPLDSIQQWIQQKVDEQSRNVYLVSLAVPTGWSRGDPMPAAGSGLRYSAQTLEYLAPGKDGLRLRRVVVAPGGTLATLLDLATSLAAVHGWEVSQATTWLLTGISPLVGLIRITEKDPPIRHGEWRAWSQRVVLTVHPAATPKEVADAYRTTRDGLGIAESYGKRRIRSLSLKHLTLATFLAQREGTWQEKMAAWNREHGKLGTYSQPSNFRRDARLARTRVLNIGYSPGLSSDDKPIPADTVLLTNAGASSSVEPSTTN